MEPNYAPGAASVFGFENNPLSPVLAGGLTTYCAPDGNVPGYVFGLFLALFIF